jgi:hypothetical protein
MRPSVFQTVWNWCKPYIVPFLYILVAFVAGIAIGKTLKDTPPVIPDIVQPNPPEPSPPVPLPDEIVMTSEQARLTRQAIGLVSDDVTSGRLYDTHLTIRALSSLLPSIVREQVLNELGTPDMSFMRDALDILEGKIIVRN